MPSVRECVAGCQSTHLYQFPSVEKDIVRRGKWLHAFGINDVKLHLFACTNHFSERMRCGRRLKPNAIPNINIRQALVLPELEEHNYAVMSFKYLDRGNVTKRLSADALPDVKLDANMHMGRPGTRDPPNKNLDNGNLCRNAEREICNQVLNTASLVSSQHNNMENDNATSYEKIHSTENKTPQQYFMSALDAENFSSQVPPLLLIPLKVIDPLQCNDNATARKKCVIADDRQVQTIRTLNKEKERDKEFYLLRQKVIRLESQLEKLKKELKTEKSLHYHIYAHGRLGPKGSKHCTEFATQKRRKSF